MKKLIGLFAVLSLFYPAHTQQVTKEFNRLMMDDDFTRLAGNWNQLSNADNLFIGTDRGFQVWRKNLKSGFFLLPEKSEMYTVFEASVHFGFEPGAKNQSAGMVLQAQADGSGALVIEVNRKKQYRIRRAVNNRMISISGEGEGWVKAGKYITTGENELMVRTYDKIYDLYINGSFVKSFTEIEYSEGKIGLYIGPGSKAVFHRLNVKTDDDHATQKGSGTGPVDEEKTLAQVIVKLKESINKKDKRIAELETELRMAQSRGQQDTVILRQKNEAESRWMSCARELESLKSDRELLQIRVKNLEDFREQIKNSENGDVIINLTKLSATQKEQIETLQKANKVQAQAIEQLKQERADAEALLKKKTAVVEQYQNEQILLLQRIIEKDSIIAALEEKVKLLDDALTSCTAYTPPRKSEAARPRKKKDKKKEQPVLFDE